MVKFDALVQRGFSLLCFVFLVACGVASVAVADASSQQSQKRPFELKTPVSVVEAISGPGLLSRPTVLLVTRRGAQDSATAQIRQIVRQLADEMPPEVFCIHEYIVASTSKDLAFLSSLLPHGDGVVPLLAFFGGTTTKSGVVAGSPVSNMPVLFPIYYSTSSSTPLSMSTYEDVRRWALSNVPTRYADPVTFRLLQSVHFAFSPAHLRASLQERRRAVLQNHSIAVSPTLVVMAYCHISAAGSEEVMAALSSLASQAGNGVLVFATESPAVAAAWGLQQWNTATTAPMEAVWSAYETLPASGAPQTLLQETSGPHLLTSITDVVRAFSSPLRAATMTAEAAEAAVLQTWKQSIMAFATVSPLRQITSMSELVQEMASLQQAIKVLFLLRSTDELWFYNHHRVAVETATRMQKTSLRVARKRSSAASDAASLWTPPFRLEAFWVDAEKSPEVAQALHVNQVPSVQLLLPLQSRFKSAAAESAGGEDRAEQAAVEDVFIGVHPINNFDLFHAAALDDGASMLQPRSPKEAQVQYPSDADELLRYLSSEAMPKSSQYGMVPISFQRLQGLVAVQSSSSAAVVGPNYQYLKLEYRFFASSSTVEPEEGPSYVKDIITGAVQLPPFDAAAAGALASGRKNVTLSAKELARRKTMEEELARRRQAKADRIRAKAAEEEERRLRDAAVLREGVEEALRQGDIGETKVPSHAFVVKRPLLQRSQGGRHVSNPIGSPPSPHSGDSEDEIDNAEASRRQWHYQQYLKWSTESRVVAAKCISLDSDNSARIIVSFDI